MITNLILQRQAFVKSLSDGNHTGTYSTEVRADGSFKNTVTQSMWLSWQASRKHTMGEFNLEEPEEDTAEVATAFLKENLRAIATERFNRTPYSLPKTALFLQAARLFATAHDLDSDEAIERVDEELNHLCITFVMETLK